MSDGQGPYAILLVLWLVLVASWLVSRRLPLAKSLKMAVAWIAIFGAVFLTFFYLAQG